MYDPVNMRDTKRKRWHRISNQQAPGPKYWTKTSFVKKRLSHRRRIAKARKIGGKR